MSHPRLLRTDWATVQVRSAGAENTRTNWPSGPREGAGGDTAAVTGDAGMGAGDVSTAGGGAAAPAASAGAAPGDVAPAGGRAVAGVLGSSPTSTRSSEGSRAPPWRSIVMRKMSGDHAARGGATRRVPAPCESTASNPADTRFPRLMLPSHS